MIRINLSPKAEAERRLRRQRSTQPRLKDRFRSLFRKITRSPEVVAAKSQSRAAQTRALGYAMARVIREWSDHRRMVKQERRARIVARIAKIGAWRELLFMLITTTGQQFRKWYYLRRDFNILRKEARANRIKRVYYPMFCDACRRFYSWIQIDWEDRFFKLSRFTSWFKRKREAFSAWWQRRRERKKKREQKKAEGWNILPRRNLLLIALPLTAMIAGIAFHLNWLWPLFLWATMWLTVWSTIGWRMKIINALVVGIWAIFTIAHFTR